MPVLRTRFLLILSPSCFAACGHHLSPRVAIVFALLSTVEVLRRTPPHRIRLFSSSPRTHPSLNISHAPTVTSNVYCYVLVCHKRIRVHLLPPPPNYWYTSFLFLAGPGPLYEPTVSAFSRSPYGRANTFYFPSLLLTPSISPRVNLLFL